MLTKSVESLKIKMVTFIRDFQKEAKGTGG